jgi:glycerol-3-phosphate O-acyltransferase
VERRLKLGLVGSALEAYARTLLAGKERRIFFVPATINYLVTLEAETLIADFLSEAGKGRFIIEDDESTRFARVGTFMKKLLGMHGSVAIRFSDPIDPFGNKVDEDGVSHDARGRAVDPSTYVKNARGEVTIDPARDAQYTRELGEEICRAYAKDTVVMATHLTAAACFARLRSAAPAGDLFTVLRQREAVPVPRDDLAKDVCHLRDALLALEREGGVVASDTLRRASGGDIVESAVRAFTSYHSTPVLRSVPEGILLSDTNLLFYYQNRLAGHGLAWDVIAPPGMLPSRSPATARAATPAQAGGGAA